jgi:hypothetical protein
MLLEKEARLGRWLKSRFLTGLSAWFGMTSVRFGAGFRITRVRVGIGFGMTRVVLGQPTQ